MKVEVCKFKAEENEERHEIGINSVVRKRNSSFQFLSAQHKGRNGFNKFLEISSPLMNETLSISEHERRSLNTRKSDRLYSNEWNAIEIFPISFQTIHSNQLWLLENYLSVSTGRVISINFN